MQTVLFIISSTRHLCRDRQEGVYRHFNGSAYHVQVVERSFHRVNVREIIDFWQPVGIIAECGSGADELKDDAFGDLPVVYVDADPVARGPGFYVGSDASSIGRLAAEHLLALDLPHYAYVSYRVPIFWCRARRDAFVRELAARGRGCSVMPTERELPPLRRQKVLTDWIAALPRPCGVFAANDQTAEEVVNACVRIGLTVPDDIAVLGVDNDELICENAPTSISSIEMDFVARGLHAAQMLQNLIEHSDRTPETRTFQAVRVVRRLSTTVIACDSRRVARALDHIRLHACAGIGVADVAAAMDVPRRTAELHFRRATGRSIHEAIDEVRFAKVFDLLRNPRQRLDALPGLCGFSTDVALRKAFRQRTGLSMRAWRRACSVNVA